MVGHFEVDPICGDIGTKKVTAYLADELSKHHQVMRLNIRNIGNWHRVRQFEPEIIHFILGPATIWSFAAMKMLSLCYRRAKTVLLATLPIFSCSKLATFSKPDLVLVQSHHAEEAFAQLGCQTQFLPNGVDTGRFTPVSEAAKQKLREGLALDTDKFIILHVGPLKRSRNVQLLSRVQEKDNQVVIIGRHPIERELYQALKAKGCLIWDKYFTNIENIYQLSDCYVFPVLSVEKPASIELPLSVLEAMSCNIPVITTRFRSLSELFAEGDGLVFAEEETDLLEGVERIKAGKEVVKTREKVLPFTWTKVCQRLDGVYEQLLTQ